MSKRPPPPAPAPPPPAAPAAAAPPPPLPWRTIALVAGVAASVRLLWLPTVLSDPVAHWHEWDQTDGFTYEMWAKEIGKGNWLLRDVPRPPHNWEAMLGTPGEFTAWEGGPNVFRHAPLYAYGLAAAHAVFGPSPVPVLFLQVLLGIAWAVATQLLGRKLFGEVAGAAAGIAAGIYGPVLFLEAQVLRDAPALLLQALGLLALARAGASGRAAAWVGTGVLLGLTVLLKEATGVLAVAAVGWLAWRGLVGKVPGAARGAALVAAGGAIAFAPVVARNLAVGARPLSLSSRGPQVIATANAPDTQAFGLVYETTSGAGEILRKSGGGGLATALEVLRSVPFGRLLGGYVLRAIACWTPYEGPDNANYWFYRDRSWILGLLPVFHCLFGPAAVGAWLAWRRRRELSPLLALVFAEIILLALALPVGFPQCRYRVMLVPLLLPFAGYAVAGAVAAWRGGAQGRAALLAGGALVGALFSAAGERTLQAGPRPLAAFRDRPADYSVSASILDGHGQLAEALEELDRGLARFEHPDERLPLQRNKVALLLNARELERARAEAKRWAESEPNPEWAATYEALGLGTPPPGSRRLAPVPR